MKPLVRKPVVTLVVLLALASSTLAQERRRVAEDLMRTADTLRAQKKKESLLEGARKYEEAAAIWKELGDIDEEAIALGQLGIIIRDLGEPQRAIEYLDRSLVLARQANDRVLEAGSLLRQAIAYDDLGDRRRQMELSRAALEIAIETKDRLLEADALQNLASAHYRAAELDEALNNFKTALAIYRSRQDKNNEAVALVNIGVAYRAFGMTEDAIDHYEAALPIVRSLGNDHFAATILNNIGEAYLALDLSIQARDNLSDALALRQKVGDRLGESITLSGLSTASLDLGETEKAMEYSVRELRITREIRSRRNEAAALNQIGNIYLRMRKYPDAELSYTQALAIRREVGDRLGEVRSVHGLAVVQRDRGEVRKAKATIEQAIATVESVRASIISRQQRQSFFATVQDVYAEHVAILMHLNDKEPGKGFDGMALQASENAKARGLVECLAEANAGFGKEIPTEMIERRRTLEQQLAKQEASADAVQDEDEIPAIQKDLRATAAELGELDAEIKRRDPRYAALIAPKTPDIGTIQKHLDTNTVLLEYSVSGDQAFLWVVSNTSVRAIRLGRSREIKDKAKQYYRLVSERGPTGTTDGIEKELGSLLIGSARPTLAGKRLLIVPDGILAYVPFAALTTTENPRRLIVDSEIVSLPSAGTLIEIRKGRQGARSPAKSVAILADPVFDIADRRVARELLAKQSELDLNATVRRSFRDVKRDYTFSRLPGSRDEASAISMLVPPTQRLVLLDFAADLKAATSSELAHYRIVHFSTHGISNSIHPDLSGVVFSLVDENGKSREGFLRLGHIYDLDLNADLVVLSACETAIGKEVRGEGLIALTNGFMHAGSRSVAATLWSVSDQATFELMRRFYQRMLGSRKLRPAAALREAQIEMSKSSMYKAPFYWAAFTIQGEWR